MQKPTMIMHPRNPRAQFKLSSKWPMLHLTRPQDRRKKFSFSRILLNILRSRQREHKCLIKLLHLQKQKVNSWNSWLMLKRAPASWKGHHQEYTKWQNRLKRRELTSFKTPLIKTAWSSDLCWIKRNEMKNHRSHQQRREWKFPM